MRIETSQEPPFEDALDWFQFAYTTNWAADHVAPESTVLTQSTVAEGGERFPEILSHLRRLYPEVYDRVVSLGQAPERREFLIREGRGLSGGTSNVTIFSK